MGKKSSGATQVPELLARLQAEFPKKKQAFESILRQAGVEETITQTVQPPTRVDTLPTFDRNTTRPVSPMLRDRFASAGRWQEGIDTWLGVEEMAARMRN